MNDDRIERNDEITEPNEQQQNNVQHHEVNTQSENISEVNDTPKNIEVSNPSVNIPAVDIPDVSIPEVHKPAENIEHSTQNEVETNDTNTAKAPDSENSNFNFVPAQQDIHAQNRMDETQKNWQMQNFQSNMNPNISNNMNPNINNNVNPNMNSQNSGLPNYGNVNYNSPNYNNNYYKENYKKPAKKSDVWKYVLVSIVSSLIGGAILTVMLLVVAPAIQPELKSFVGGIFPDAVTENAQPTVGELKRVEIVQNAESAVTSVAEKVGPSVVGIRTTYQNTNELFGVQSEGGEGSGIIISSDGYILTNHHVIENALNDRTRKVQSGAKIQVYLPNKIDKPYTAEVKGYDSKTDLAVLKINETNLNAIEFGNSDDLKVGEPAIAIGNPGGLEYMGSVTQGVVSGLNRTVQLDGGRKIRLIQTDAAINPGNSGGALVNIKGQLIGVNTIKMVATGFEGLGFAIPVNDAKKIADELIKNTYISKPYLGISVDQRYTEEIAKENNMPMGVYVADVEILGAAEKAGIQAGDVITKFNNKTVKAYADLEDEKNKCKPGDTVSIEIYREGKTKTVKVKLGETK